MTPTQETGKRIVSKGAYVRAQGKRLLLSMSGAGLLFAAWAGMKMALPVVSFIKREFPLTMRRGVWSDLFFLVLMVAPLIIAFHVARQGIRSIQRATSIDPGVPLTQANIDDVPAPESLVRASAEPLQAQEAVLLRAATQGQETPPEQLVRAGGGPQGNLQA